MDACGCMSICASERGPMPTATSAAIATATSGATPLLPTPTHPPPHPPPNWHGTCTLVHPRDSAAAPQQVNHPHRLLLLAFVTLLKSRTLRTCANTPPPAPAAPAATQRSLPSPHAASWSLRLQPPAVGTRAWRSAALPWPSDG
eukprot:307068-Chlamydomonas_euryale.AAC.4